jgi:tyrosine aminotransferase
MVAGKIKVSQQAINTTNPIREIVDKIKVPPNPDKPVIPLSIGDPTVFGNLKTCAILQQGVQEAVAGGKADGYPPAVGYLEARAAVAKEYSSDKETIDPDDVILASGCSGALELVIPAMADPGDNILLPQPGFSLYTTICESHGITCRYYRLKPDQDWEVDLEHLASLIDDKTMAVLVNNPSNPCSSVYSQEHLTAILSLCEAKGLPIIADEIYNKMSFDRTRDVTLASISSKVPIIAVGGIAKRFLVPGWRLGWVLIHDREDRLTLVKDGIMRLATLILGPNSLVQAALPKLFVDTPPEFHKDLIDTLASNARYCAKRVAAIDGLDAITPQGAMYMMIRFDPSVYADIPDDVEMAKLLMSEESVAVLPGSVFGIANYFRIVFCPSEVKLAEAFDRMEAFCTRHKKK